MGIFNVVGGRVFISRRSLRKLLGDKTVGESRSIEDSTEKKGKGKIQRVPQSQTAALPRHQEEEETDKSKQVQIEQTYEKHWD